MGRCKCSVHLISKPLEWGRDLTTKIVVSVDGLGPAARQKILAVAEAAGAQVHFIPEADGWRGALAGAEIALGLPPVAMVEASALRFLQLHSSGYDQYKTPALCGATTLTIANARGVAAQAVAEQCLSMMFAFARRLPFQLRNQANHRWQRADSYERLHGSTVTIAGTGGIGSALGTMCHAIGMRVFAVQRRPEKPAFAERIFPFERLPEALAQTQHLALTLPTISSTSPLIGREQLAALQQGAFVYNMARAALLDYDALLDALQSKHLAGAGLDVFPTEPLSPASPWWDRDDVMVAPHSGGRFAGEMDALAALFADNLARYFARQPLLNIVLPEAQRA